MSELKPCPFCGGKPLFIRLPELHLHFLAVGCMNEKCNARVSGNTKEEVITAWNTRKGEAE